MRGSGGRKSLIGVQGQSPGRGFRDEVPQKLKLFLCRKRDFFCSLQDKIKYYVYLVDAFWRRNYITATPETTRRHRSPSCSSKSTTSYFYLSHRYSIARGRL